MRFTAFGLQFALIFLLIVSNASAQSIENATRRINDIKRDTTYIYAEATTRVKSDAIDDARALLEANINQWIEASKKDGVGETIAIAKLEKELSAIQTTRGEFYRAFVYVKKSSITTLDNKSDIILCGQQNSQSLTSFEPQNELPSMPVVVNLSDANCNTQRPNEQKYQQTDFEMSMLSVNRFEGIKKFINNLKEENRILDYGKYQTIPSFGDCFLFIYDKNGDIPAYLRRSSMKYLNIKDGSDDDVKNYDGCGAFWFSLK